MMWLSVTNLVWKLKFDFGFISGLFYYRKKEKKITLPYALPSERTIAAFILLAFWPFPSLVRFLFPISFITVYWDGNKTNTVIVG